ncbi:NAD(P)/FAD-dependent oxidoreductase [Micromonospora zamorensis]|uniref:NAD(P)/FAD-dependent oxidoreductase n=1 Tax=Micromonospora zamorensis TaxID=709883 RepID=UPI003D98B2C2
MRVTVVGAGLAGTLLAWRLRALRPDVRLTLVTGLRRPDATGASGGLVRGFETGAAQAELAAESLAELSASPLLRGWSGYQEIGSVVLLPDPPDQRCVRPVEDLLPGSLRLLDGNALGGTLPFRGLPAGVVGVVERRAGFLSPALFRDRVLDALRAEGVRIVDRPASRVTPTAEVVCADGTTVDADVTVLAVGAWTPSFLAASGLDGQGLRTKQIQYTRFPVTLPALGAFVDDTTGLYGRPVGREAFLLGVPGDTWDVAPDATAPDPALVRRLSRCVKERLGVQPVAGSSTASFDCYADEGGLRLRPVRGAQRVLTFTGGSGGAAKTALAASRRAARALPT